MLALLGDQPGQLTQDVPGQSPSWELPPLGEAGQLVTRSCLPGPVSRARWHHGNVPCLPVGQGVPGCLPHCILGRPVLRSSQAKCPAGLALATTGWQHTLARVCGVQGAREAVPIPMGQLQALARLRKGCRAGARVSHLSRPML